MLSCSEARGLEPGFRSLATAIGTRCTRRSSIGGSFVSNNIEDYYLNPFELGYGFYIGWKKEFIGKAALTKLKDAKNRQKVTIEWNRDDLLKVAGSKYALVIYAAKRARQINSYYSQLGEGLLEYVGPLVDSVAQEKPLSIALREIIEDKLTIEAEKITEEQQRALYDFRAVAGDRLLMSGRAAAVFGEAAP